MNFGDQEVDARYQTKSKGSLDKRIRKDCFC